jgi:hypothetical protein
MVASNEELAPRAYISRVFSELPRNPMVNLGNIAIDPRGQSRGHILEVELLRELKHIISSMSISACKVHLLNHGPGLLTAKKSFGPSQSPPWDSPWKPLHVPPQRGFEISPQCRTGLCALEARTTTQ